MGYDLGGSGGTSFPFDKIGDTVTGTIVDVEERQQTDIDTGQPAFWPDGKPKLQHMVTLQTDLADDADDDGLRTVYLRGSRKPESKSTLAAVIGAVKATTGGTALDKGGTLTLRFVGEVPPTQRGRNPAKQYDATYRPPSVSLDGAPQPGPSPQPPLPYPPQTGPQQPAAPTYAPPQPPQPPVNGAAGLRGFLNGQPITAEQYAGMAAAGVNPEQLAGWVAVS